MKTLLTQKENFLSYCQYEKNLSSKTLSAYDTDLLQFIKFLKKITCEIEVQKVAKEMIREYLKEISKRLKPKSVKRKIATLKAFFSFLEFEDTIVVSPFRKLRIKIKEPIALPAFLSLEEVKTILEYAYQEKKECRDKNSWRYFSIVRDITVLELLFATGVRVSELCNLKINQIDLSRNKIIILGKGRKERVIFIGQTNALATLNEYLGLFKPWFTNESNLFFNRLGNSLSSQSVRLMVKKYSRNAGIKKRITPHTFRHTFATLLLEEGVDIKYIQQFLGHSSIMTTQIYSHASSRKLEEIIVEMHPRGKILGIGCS